MNSEIKYIMHSISRDTPAYAYPPVRDIFAWQQDMMRSLQDWVSNVPQVGSQDADATKSLCKIKYNETWFCYSVLAQVFQPPQTKISTYASTRLSSYFEGLVSYTDLEIFYTADWLFIPYF